jgi:hypothetical protein
MSLTTQKLRTYLYRITFMSHIFHSKNLLMLNIVLVFFSIFSVAFAKNYQDDICSQFNSLSVPAFDLPTVEDQTALQGCNSVKLYYGIGMPVDYVKARQCALIHQNHDVDKINDVDILTMIYMNGDKVQKNRGLAIKFACLNQIDFDPGCADSASVDNNTPDFSQCEDEGFNGNSAIVHINPSTLRFVNEMATADVEKISDNDKAEDSFQTALLSFENGHFPQFSSQGFQESDIQLKELYSQVIKTANYIDKHKPFPDSEYNDAETAIQEAWLQYQVAWVYFGVTRYRQVAENSWKTWLIKQRIQQLQANLSLLQGFETEIKKSDT